MACTIAPSRIYDKPLQPTPILLLNHFCALRKRPRKTDDFVFIFDDNKKEQAFIVNNGLIDISDSAKKSNVRKNESIQKSNDRKQKDAANKKEKRSKETDEQKK